MLLRGMDEPSIRMLLRRRLSPDISQQLARRIHGASRGNPFLALEMGRTVLAEGVPAVGERLPVPEDVRDMVAQRVAAFPASTRRALLRAAAAPTGRCPSRTPRPC
ncbi:MAG: hypothetical protein U0Y82_11670 [Thermoleophilia bacterium]